MLIGSLPIAQANNEIFAVQSRASTPNFQLFLNLADDSTVTTTGPLFGPSGGVFGLTYLNDTIYAAELANGSSDEYLATIPHEGALFGQGARVSGSPIGFANVESLAAADGILYGTSINFAAHRTTLITINSSSGIGSSIGVGDFDVIIVGLAFDPLADILYGTGIPFGDPVTGVLTPNLYTLNRSTGDTTLVGDLGVELQSLAWDTNLGLIGAFDHLYEINTVTGSASQIGTTDFTDGIPGMFNGIYSLAAVVEPSVFVTPDSFTVTRGDYVSGGLPELAESDNMDLTLRRRTSDIQSRTEFEVKGTSSTATPTSFEFTLEGAVFARGNVIQTIELFDYVAAAWELVDTRDAARSPSPDSVVTVAATGDLSRFVEEKTMCIEARIHFQSDSPRQRFASNTDQAIWTIE